MATRLGVTVLLLALLNACATPRVVRLDTGQGSPLEYRLSSSNKSVKVNAEAFEEALALVRASHSGKVEDTRWQRLMRKSFGGLCEPGQRRDHRISCSTTG